jgi:phenylalanyl-tRNA synthetase beta chain
MTLICDDAGPEAIGGVMGGEHSGCTEETTNVFVEAAYFDPTRTAPPGASSRSTPTRATASSAGSTPPSLWGMEMATRLILDLCGGEPSELVIAGAVPDTARAYALDPRGRLAGGHGDPAETQVATLEALGFTVRTPAATGVFSVRRRAGGPTCRARPIWSRRSPASPRSPSSGPKPMPRGAEGALGPALTPRQRRIRRVRRALAAQGLNECVTYSFVSETEAALFGGGGAEMALENPISSEMSHMRPSALPHLLAAAARNQARGADGVALFEVGPGLHGPEPGEQPNVAVGLRSAHARRANGPARAAAAMLTRAALGADRKHIVGATVFDVFDGAKASAQLGEGRKSVALSVRLQPRQQTFTEEEIAAIGASIVTAVARATGGVLRS